MFIVALFVAVINSFDPDTGKDWRQVEKGMTEDETVGWHLWLDGYEFEQALEVGDVQVSLVCCSPWRRKESDLTEWVNWTDYKYLIKTRNDPNIHQEINA